MKKVLLFIVTSMLAPMALAQVRMSTEAFPITPAADALPIVPLVQDPRPGEGHRSQMPAPAGDRASDSKHRVWKIQDGDIRLSDALKRWAADAGYQLRWEAERHVMISGNGSFHGDFESAVVDALKTPGILFSEYPLEVCFYPNSPPLARVTRQGEQAQYCDPMSDASTAAK
jgi:hypothetical protein